VDEVTDLKHDLIPEMLRLDIGMRAVISSLGELCRIREDWVLREGLDNFARWFVDCLNAAYQDDWFVKHGSRRPYLRHVCLSPTDSIVNYRFRDIPDAYGALLTLVLAAHSRRLVRWPRPPTWDELWIAVAEKRLFRRVKKGFRAEVRALLREHYTDRTQLKTEVERAAERKLRQYARNLRNALDELA
jgi:hypothetical protein